MNERYLKFAFHTAAANWIEWRADYQFKGIPRELPVLGDQDRYKSFLNEYRLLRRVNQNKRLQLRTYLANSHDRFANALKSADGTGIDELSDAMGQRFRNLGRQRSFLSKLATFAMPARFVPWDRFARKGVASLDGGPANGNFRSYNAYLSAVMGAWKGATGDEIRQFLKDADIPEVGQHKNAFGLRVLDDYLMVLGGRWRQIDRDT